MTFEQYCKAIGVVEEKTGCSNDVAIATMEEVTEIFNLTPEENFVDFIEFMIRELGE